MVTMRTKNRILKVFFGVLVLVNCAIAQQPDPPKSEPTAQISKWIAQLNDSDYPRRNDAVALLAEQPGAALPLLEQELKKETDSNRRWWIKVAIQECRKNQPRPGEISSSPSHSEGLQVCETCQSGDGLFVVVERDGARCWEVPKKGNYLYFTAGEKFRREAGATLEIQVEYLDTGTGRIGLDYDSTDAWAPVGGAYERHSTIIHCTNTGQWRKTRFHLPNARFRGSENNQTDFRFYNGGDDMIIRAVRVWPSSGDD